MKDLQLSYRKTCFNSIFTLSLVFKCCVSSWCFGSHGRITRLATKENEKEEGNKPTNGIILDMSSKCFHKIACHS